MGQSTDAYVFYGYCWDDEDVEFSTDMEEVVKTILAERGHPNPWDSYPESGNRAEADAWMRENDAALDAYRDLERQVEAELGVAWGSHCSDSCPMPYLSVAGTQITAWRGTPRPVPSVEVDPAWKGKLDAFLESQGIEPPAGENQPGWWTASWWG